MFLRSINFKYHASAWLVLLAILAIVVPSSFAQQQYRCGVNVMETIEYGEVIQSAIDYNQAAFFCFDAERGDTVTAIVQPIEGSGNLAPSVYITKGVNESEQDIFDNAFAEGIATEILQPVGASVTIDADNTYMIMVIGGQGTRGEFVLGLQVEEAQSILGTTTDAEATEEALSPDSLAPETINLCELEDVGAVPLNYGNTLNASITPEVPQALFCFEGKAGEFAKIRVGNVSGEIIPFVVIGNPIATAEGTEIYAQGVAGNTDEAAQIIYELLEDGTYLIAVGPANSVAGEFFIELSTADAAPVDFTCENEPLSILSQSQWVLTLNEDENQNIIYTIGCTNTIIMNIFGGNFILDYRINSEGAFVFVMGDKEFSTVSLDENNWVVQSSGDDEQELTLERITNESCGEAPLSELIRGAWIIEGESLFVVDFMCNGVAFVDNQGVTVAANYTLEDSVIEIIIPEANQLLFAGEIVVDGDSMILRDAQGDIPFVNILSSDSE